MKVSRSPLVFALSLLLALVVNLIALPQPASALMPPILLLVLGYWSVYGNNYPVQLLAVVMGLILDAVWACPLGQHGLAYLLMAFACSASRVSLSRQPLVQQGLVMVPLLLGISLLLFWLDGMSRHGNDGWLRFASALSAIWAWPALVWLLDGMRGRDARA